MKISTILPIALLAFTAIFFTTGYAEETPASAQLTAPTLEMTEGEVRKVNKDTQKLTLKHGPIKNLDMPGMTMVFQVKTPAMLDQVKVGDRVQFFAEKIGGAIVVVEIHVLP